MPLGCSGNSCDRAEADSNRDPSHTSNAYGPDTVTATFAGALLTGGAALARAVAAGSVAGSAPFLTGGGSADFFVATAGGAGLLVAPCGEVVSGGTVAVTGGGVTAAGGALGGSAVARRDPSAAGSDAGVAGASDRSIG